MTIGQLFDNCPENFFALHHGVECHQNLKFLKKIQYQNNILSQICKFVYIIRVIDLCLLYIYIYVLQSCESFSSKSYASPQGRGYIITHIHGRTNPLM